MYSVDRTHARLIFWAGFGVAMVLAVMLFSRNTLAAVPNAVPGTNATSPNLTATPTPCPGDYAITQTEGATPVPGSVLVSGSQCDDCAAGVALPFSYSLYGHNFNSATLTANGQLVFSAPVDPSYSNTCLPDPYSNYAIFAHWTDLTMDPGYQSCLQYTSGCGAYTSVSGSAPNRIFNIEWRALTFDVQNLVNFEIRLYEGQQRFDIVYITVDQPGHSSDATVGVQQDTGTTSTTYQCPTQPGSLSNGTLLRFDFASQCGQSTPTNTPTNTRTYTPTNTPASTNTPTRTSTRTATANSTRTATASPTRTSTVSPTVTPTNSPTTQPTATRTPMPSATPSPTSTLTRTVTATPTGTPTPAQNGVLVGHVTWQARPSQPSAMQQVPVTLTLKLGSTEYDYPPQTTDASGFFTTSVGTLPAGTYNWRVKGTKWLANSGTVVLSGASRTQQEMGLMRTGDADNDNMVNMSDFQIVKSAFGRTCGMTSYDNRADFNDDCRVSVYDFYSLRLNFGQSGAPPISPGMGR